MAENQQNKGTLLSQTFKVVESKVFIYFLFWPFGRDMALFRFLTLIAKMILWPYLGQMTENYNHLPSCDSLLIKCRSFRVLTKALL